MAEGRGGEWDKKELEYVMYKDKFAMINVISIYDKYTLIEKNKVFRKEN